MLASILASILEHYSSLMQQHRHKVGLFIGAYVLLVQSLFLLDIPAFGDSSFLRKVDNPNFLVLFTNASILVGLTIVLTLLILGSFSHFHSFLRSSLHSLSILYEQYSQLKGEGRKFHIKDYLCDCSPISKKELVYIGSFCILFLHTLAIFRIWHLIQVGMGILNRDSTDILYIQVIMAQAVTAIVSAFLLLQILIILRYSLILRKKLSDLEEAFGNLDKLRNDMFEQLGERNGTPQSK